MPAIFLPILEWRPESVVEVLLKNGVKNRNELAERLGPLGINRATIYRTFEKDWTGRASDVVLTAMAYVFAVPLTLLVHEPSAKKAS